MSTAIVPLSKPAPVVLASDAFMPVFTIESALQRRDQMVSFVKQIMHEGVDYGKIPGSDKDVLLKPGAEKLSSFFGFSPSFDLVERIEDWTGENHGGEPFFYYLYKCRLVKNERIIGEGDGSCNSWESKYRYRWMNEETIPESVNKAKLLKRGGKQTLAEFTFSVDKAETGGQYGKPPEYWQRFQEAIANGTARKGTKKTKAGKTFDTWELDIDATQYRVPNPDVADIVNTCQKMAQKRSLIAAVLIGVNASDYFTQDMDDFVPEQQTRSSAAEEEPTQEQHQQNNLEQQKALADRRIAEEKEKAEHRAKLAANAAQKAAAEKELPEALALIYRRMTGFTETVKVFEDFKASIAELTGNEVDYYRIIGEAGMKHGNDLAGKKAGDIKAAVRNLYEFCVKVCEPPAVDTETRNAIINEAQLPDALSMRGTG